jgi:DNA-binding NtrC family response regulator
VAQALDGAEAVARLHGFAYDALVVDLRLPDANGMDVLEEALTLFPTIRAVVITGFGTVNEAVTAIKRGAIDFLIKPFQLSQLSRVLRAGIEQRQLRQENAELRAQLQTRFGSEQHHQLQRAVCSGLSSSRREQHDSDRRRDRNGQRADRANDSSQQSASGSAFCGVQRRSDSRGARRG